MGEFKIQFYENLKICFMKLNDFLYERHMKQTNVKNVKHTIVENKKA